jgi:hypothetical protein
MSHSSAPARNLLCPPRRAIPECHLALGVDPGPTASPGSGSSSMVRLERPRFDGASFYARRTSRCARFAGPACRLRVISGPGSAYGRRPFIQDRRRPDAWKPSQHAPGRAAFRAQSRAPRSWTPWATVIEVTQVDEPGCDFTHYKGVGESFPASGKPRDVAVALRASLCFA